MNHEYVDLMVKDYIVAMLWSSTDDDGDPLDDRFGPDDLSAHAHSRCVLDCMQFVDRAGDLLDGTDPGQVGHDFWLTRNGHGVGFWARPELYNKDKAERLTDLAESFGELYPYIYRKRVCL